MDQPTRYDFLTHTHTYQQTDYLIMREIISIAAVVANVAWIYKYVRIFSSCSL